MLHYFFLIEYKINSYQKPSGGRGGGAGSDGEGGQATCGEDGLGRRHGEHGEYQRVCADMTLSLNGASGGVSISNKWWTYYKEKITPTKNTAELLAQW
jgi:hypothetical protein